MSYKNYKKNDKHQRINASKPAKSRLPWAFASLFVLVVLAAGYVLPNAWNATIGTFEPLSLQERPFRLGLDLIGGTHLVYEADLSAIDEAEKQNSLNGVRDVIERRVNAFGVSEPVVQTTKSGEAFRIIVELAGISDISEAIKQIGETPILEFKRPGNAANIVLTDEQAAAIAEANVGELEEAEALLDRALGDESFEDVAADAIGGRVFSSGFLSDDSPYVDHAGKLREGSISGDIFETDLTYSILKLTGKQEAPEFKYDEIILCHNEAFACGNHERTFEEANTIADDILARATARNFDELKEEMSENPSRDTDAWISATSTDMEVGNFLRAAEDGEFGIAKTDVGLVVLHKVDERNADQFSFDEIAVAKTNASNFVENAGWQNTGLGGAQLESSRVEFDQNTGTPYVTLVFDSEGGKMFGDMTGELIGQQIAIFLDGEVISSPVVQAKITGGEAIITGIGDIDEAKLLAQRLNAGALPVPIDLISQQTVGPTLGAISLERSLNAGLIGLVLVALFMILYYRLPGLLSVLALAGYAAIVLAIFKLLPVTLTLAGLAGFILSIGMAVDANVLIFERLKEELNLGRNLERAIDQGFRRAWTSIRDGNVTTLIACAILYWFSTSFIQGFALTLAIGVIISMFSAITITRVLLMLSARVKGFNRPSLFGVKEIR
ncbi:protein translocase subunit SecD [Candidatus Uhrbacteria bacterium]|jgi:protein-export membrane protein SecD|nr:protein translocase subunit SecD [Candidatus Uhrbacteria bacterium]